MATNLVHRILSFDAGGRCSLSMLDELPDMMWFVHDGKSGLLVLSL